MSTESELTFVEVEYTLITGKPVIPIRIHRSYVLDGWLSTSLASHSVLNFTDTEDFDAGMKQLQRHVSAIAGLDAASGNGCYPTIQSHTHTHTHTHTPWPSFNSVAQNWQPVAA